METAVRSFRFLYSVQLNRAEASCKNCGHAIAQCFYIQHTETNVTMVVGSECVGHLLCPDDVSSFEVTKRRLTRASAQWRKQLPAALPNETRTDYINRRVVEMANARKAHKDWVATCKLERYGECSEYPVTIAGVTRQMAKECGGDPTRYQHFGNYSWDKWVYEQREAIFKWWKSEMTTRITNNQKLFGDKHQANPFDFTKTSWDVRKV